MENLTNGQHSFLSYYIRELKHIVSPLQFVKFKGLIALLQCLWSEGFQWRSYVPLTVQLNFDRCFRMVKMVKLTTKKDSKWTSIKMPHHRRSVNTWIIDLCWKLISRTDHVPRDSSESPKTSFDQKVFSLSKYFTTMYLQTEEHEKLIVTFVPKFGFWISEPLLLYMGTYKS